MSDKRQAQRDQRSARSGHCGYPSMKKGPASKARRAWAAKAEPLHDGRGNGHRAVRGWQPAHPSAGAPWRRAWNETLRHLPQSMTARPPGKRRHASTSKRGRGEEIARLILWATHSRLQPIIDAAKMVKRHLTTCPPTFTRRMTNAVTGKLSSSPSTSTAVASTSTRRPTRFPDEPIFEPRCLILIDRLRARRMVERFIVSKIEHLRDLNMIRFKIRRSFLSGPFLATFLVGSVSFAQAVSFGPPSNSPFGRPGVSLGSAAIGDFNYYFGDGQPDLAVADNGPNGGVWTMGGAKGPEMLESSRYAAGALFACWAASALAQVSDSPDAGTAPAPTVVVQCPPSDDERALKAQLNEARGRLAKAKEESGMPDHAVAALLASDRPDLAALVVFKRRHILGSGKGRVRVVEAEVYMSPHPDETMTAVVVTLRNPREAPTWEPKEASIRAHFGGNPPVPVALHSVPQRILPGQTARIALVFDRLDVKLEESPATLALLRDGKWEMEIELHPSDVQVASAQPGDGR